MRLIQNNTTPTHIQTTLPKANRVRESFQITEAYIKALVGIIPTLPYTIYIITKIYK